MLKATRRPLILCVEDEPLLLRDLCEELEDAGYQAIGVPDVAAAHVLLERMTPALILCDINLPGQSGLDLLAELRETDTLPDVPFLLLTAQADRSHQLRGKWAGADDYLVKPVDYDMLLATVAARLAQVGRMVRSHSSHLQRQAEDVHAQWYGVLDGMKHCALVCDSKLAVHFANRSAYESCYGDSAQSPVQVDSVGRMVLHQSITGHPQLQAFLRSADDAVSLDLPERRGSAPRWRVAVQALNERGTPAAQAAGAASKWVFFITDLGKPGVSISSSIAQRFALTPTEIQVATLLVDGHTKQQMCAQLQVSASTMAFHLRNLFSKTGTGRQAELVAVLLSSAYGEAAASAPALAPAQAPVQG